jgi:phospholipase C
MSVPDLSRRRFLQYTGLGAAAAVTAGCSGGPEAAASVAGRSAAAGAALPEGWTGTIADVKHVVILMQENRSLDH